MEKNQGEIAVLKCKSCKKLFIPPKYICPECAHDVLEEVNISGNGKVYTHTTIRVPPTAYKDSPPYDLAIIELQEDLRVTARMAYDEKKEIAIENPVSFAGTDEQGNWVFRLL